jgi:excisionase family DNA binding protein
MTTRTHHPASNVVAFRPRHERSRPTAATESAGSTYRGEVPEIDTARLTYTVDEVAYLLKLSRGTTYQYVRDGVIPAERIGRRWVISRKRLHAWLDGLETC